MIAGCGQPNDDTVPVPDATLADLDPVEVDRLIDRLKRRRGQVFSRFDTTLLPAPRRNRSLLA